MHMSTLSQKNRLCRDTVRRDYCTICGNWRVSTCSEVERENASEIENRETGGRIRERASGMGRGRYY